MGTNTITFSNLPPTHTYVLFIGCKRILIILLLVCLTNYTQAQDFTFSVTVSGGTPTGYCDVTTFTLNITNTGGASAFTGLIKFKTLEFRIIDNAELPNLIVTTGNAFGKTHFDFTTPTIPTGISISYAYQVMVTPYDGVIPQLVEHSVTRIANSYKLNADANLASSEIEPIPQPGYNSLRISDLLNDNIPEGTGPAALFHLDENTTTPNYDTNPEKSQRIYVEDELICDIPTYSIYNGQGTGLIVMEEGSRIIVEDGATLIIDGQSIASCRKMWKGIYVESGGRLVLNECIIANAQYGIQAERGAIINVDQTIFLNNYVGFYVSPFVYQSDPENPQASYVILEHFQNNTFIGQGEMLPGYDGQSPTPLSKPYAGIEVNSLSSFTLPGQVSGGTEGHANSFENLANGIISRRTALSVGDAYFKNITGGMELSYFPKGKGIYIYDGKYAKINGSHLGGFDVYTTHFDNVDVAIDARGGSLTVNKIGMTNVDKGIVITNTQRRTFAISNNLINANNKGIEIIQCAPVTNQINSNVITVGGDPEFASCIEIDDAPVRTKWNIKFNTIDVADGLYGIKHTAGSEIHILNNPSITIWPETSVKAYGIHLQYSKSAIVQCNSLLTEEFESLYPDFYGLYAAVSEGFDISCNDLNNFKYGFNFVGNSMKCEFHSNTIERHYDGLLIGFDETLGTGIIGGQNLTGNIWTEEALDYGDKAARHFGTAEEVGYSLFTYNTNNNTDSEPPSVAASVTWFKNLNTGDLTTCSGSYSCPSVLGFSTSSSIWDSLDYDVANGDLELEHFNSSQSWQGRLHTYRKLTNANPMAIPASISTFLSAQSIANIGKFSRALDSLDRALIYDGTFISDIVDYPIELGNRFNTIQYLDSLLAYDKSNDSIIALKTLQWDSILLLEIPYVEIAFEVDSLSEISLSNMLDDLDSISPDSAWQAALKFALTELAEYALNDTLTSSTDLYELASSCPLYYGPAVYFARALIKVDSTTNDFSDLDLCKEILPRSYVSDTKLHVIKLYPNPATTETTLSTPSQFAKVRIVDAFGKIHHKGTADFDGMYVIQTASMSPGIYFVIVSDELGNSHHQKLIVVNE